MCNVRIALSVLLALPLVIPAGATDGATARHELDRIFEEQMGTPVPADLAAVFDGIARQSTSADAEATGGAPESERTRVYGDVWTVCLSKKGGCSLTHASGVFERQCRHVPVTHNLWLYVTTPAILEVEALGKAVGTWQAHTLDLDGQFVRGTITGTTCVVYNDPNMVIVRSNGIVDYEW